MAHCDTLSQGLFKKNTTVHGGIFSLTQTTVFHRNLMMMSVISSRETKPDSAARSELKRVAGYDFIIM